jgi:hypothetical protein
MIDVLKESMGLANIVGMNRGIEVVWPLWLFYFMFSNAMLSLVTARGLSKSSRTYSAMPSSSRRMPCCSPGEANHPIPKNPSRFTPRRNRVGIIVKWLVIKRRCMPLTNDWTMPSPRLLTPCLGLGIVQSFVNGIVQSFENYVQVREGHGATGLGLGVV